MSSISIFSKHSSVLLQELRLLLPSISFQEVFSADSPKLKESEIIIADYDLIAPVLYELPNTKWLQGTWAGVDKLLPSVDTNKSLPFTITRFSGKHFGRIMTEYVVAQIVHHERHFDDIRMNQKSSLWTQEGKIGQHRVISDLNIGILGLGQIGTWMAKFLNSLGATVFGFARSNTSNENAKSYIKRYYSPPNLAQFLKNCDYVVNILPHTEDTMGLLNGNILENCKERGSIFVNIGRGTIISDDELIKALERNWLSAAILDVFNTEPLPKESPLWTMPQVTITPHTAGCSRAKDIAEQFKENYENFKNNKPLPAELHITKGY